jgi:hypothetical protein
LLKRWKVLIPKLSQNIKRPYPKQDKAFLY